MHPLTRWIFRAVGLVGLALLLQSCAAPRVSDYAQQTPPLKLQEFFNGRLYAYGMFTKRSGEVVKRFKVVMDCEWTTVNGVPTGTLDEHFEYSDGTRQRRVWTVREVRPNHYVGTADDVVGEALGESSGNALNWQYTLSLPVDNTVYQVQFNDWMYLIDEKVMLNRASMRKFGFELGEVTLSFHKP